MISEGSLHSCSIHDFETTSGDAWLKHKLSLPHPDEGTSNCIYCNRKVKFDKLQQKTLEYTAPAICYYCAAKNEAQYNSKIVTIKVRPNREIEECRGF